MNESAAEWRFGNVTVVAACGRSVEGGRGRLGARLSLQLARWPPGHGGGVGREARRRCGGRERGSEAAHCRRAHAERSFTNLSSFQGATQRSMSLGAGGSIACRRPFSTAS